MGEQDVGAIESEKELRQFTTALLNDVRALERMLDEGQIESGIRRVGAEQEMFLVDRAFRPKSFAIEALGLINDPAFTTELARFNLEVNLPVYDFDGKFLSKIEDDLRKYLEGALEKLEPTGAKILLTGILPTLRLEDLGLDNMTPVPRYRALNDAMLRLRGGSGKFAMRIKGIDELYAEHDNVMLEACNTSFQLHFQVSPDEFASLYNLAQVVTAPCLASSANSPLLLGRRLWHETRVALFQQSVDARSDAEHMRGGRPRVHFGDRWVDNSILEIFREDISRYRVVLGGDTGPDSLAMLDQGRIPDLTALRLHNGTIYRWNRPCYGVADGVAHIRIENRVIPAGPTILDAVANAAFFFGLMAAGSERFGDVRELIKFEEVKGNFVAAARLGLKAQLRWLDGKDHPVDELMLNELIPMAKEGLIARGIDADDSNRYLAVLEERVRSGQTGAQWALDSLAKIGPVGTIDERMRVLTAATHARQITSEPVHMWRLAEKDEVSDWRPSYETVGQFMTTDLFTLRPTDIVDLAANIMDWERIRHIPVENEDGVLVGLLSHRTLLRLLAQGYGHTLREPVVVSEVMKRDPITVSPRTRTVDAVRLMRDKKVGSLPVLDKGHLVGIVTEHDLIDLSAQLLEDHLRNMSSG